MCSVFDEAAAHPVCTTSFCLVKLVCYLQVHKELRHRGADHLVVMVLRLINDKSGQDALWLLCCCIMPGTQRCCLQLYSSLQALS